MTKKSKKPFFLSWRHITIFSVCLITLIGSGIYLNLYAKKILSKLIKETISKSTNHLYHIDFKNIKFNPIAGNISLSQVTFKLDTPTYKKMVAQKVLSEYTFVSQADRLELKHIHLLKAYFKRSIDIQSILIDKPILNMAHQDPSSFECTTPDHRTAYQRISKHWKSIQVGEIDVQGMTIRYIDQPIKKSKITTIKNTDIKISDLFIDSLSHDDQTRLHYTKDISVNIQHYRYETDDQTYTIQLDEVSGSTSKQEAKIIGLHIIPICPEMEFSALFKEQKDRYEMTTDEITLSKIDYHLLNTTRRLSASTLAINGADMAIFLNRALPRASADRTENYPSLALKKWTIDTQIDTIKWTDSKISYSEYNPKSQRRGTIFFGRVNGSLNNVTNNTLALQRNQFCNATATGFIMDGGKLHVKFQFDLLDPKAAFTFSGNLGPMNARVLNPALKPLALIKVRKGLVEGIDFDGKGNTETCSGNLSAKYAQLRISLLKKDLINPKLKCQILASMYTNILVIRSENPSNDGNLLHASTFFYKRPIYASFFNTIWKGLAMGLMDNIGLGTAAQQQLKNLSIRMQQQKVEHQIRYMNRMKHRMERRNLRDSLKLKAQSGLTDLKTPQ